MNCVQTFARARKYGGALALSVIVLGASIADTSARRGDDQHELGQRIRLSPTEFAPGNASGVAELEVGHHGGNRPDRIEVEVRNLLPGTYTVTVFDQSGTLSETLGTIDVGIGDDDGSNNNLRGRRGRGHDNADDNSGRGRGRGRGRDDAQTQFALPGTIRTSAVGVLSITDSEGTEMLRGDFANVEDAVKGRVRQRVSVVGGQLAPDATGRAELKVNVNRNRATGTFRLDAEGLPSDTTYFLYVDDVEVQPVTTDRRGHLRVRGNHRSLDLLSISTISVRDESGTEALSATF